MPRLIELQITLDDAKKITKSVDIPPFYHEQVNEALQRCNVQIGNFTTYVNKYIDSSGEATSWLWQTPSRFSWDSNELVSFHSRLSISIQDFHNIFQRCLGTTANKQEIRKRIEEWLLHDIEESWSVPPVGMPDDIQSAIRDWIVNTEQFKTWRSELGQALICDGKPGSGKTIALSEIAGQLEEEARDNKKICVLKIFFHDRRKEKQTPGAVLRSLAGQALRYVDEVPPQLKKIFTTYTQESKLGSSLDVVSIKKIICTLAAGFDNTFCFVDALDESPQSGNELNMLLRHFSDLQTAIGMNFFITGRVDSPRRETFNIFPTKSFLEIKAKDEDLRNYVIKEISGNHKPIFNTMDAVNLPFRDEIVARVTKLSDGMCDPSLASLFIFILTLSQVLIGKAGYRQCFE